MIAVVVVGIVAAAVMEGICEMIIIWPIPNAMVKFVNAFVDEDLGVAVGFMYWCALLPKSVPLSINAKCSQVSVLCHIQRPGHYRW